MILAMLLVLSAVVLPKVYAAYGVDVDAECSVEILTTGCGYKELNGSDPAVTAYPVTVDLYKVADIDVSGRYEAVEAFQGLELSGLSMETSTEEWIALAAAAQEAVEKAAAEAASGTEGALPVATAASGSTEDGGLVLTGLETGLYLVDAQQVLSDDYQYDFTPYLISLPNNYYYRTSDDTWVYDLTGDNAIGLKPAKSDRYGDLSVNKLLTAYNETVGGASFVFQIEGTKTDIDTGDVKTVYSDVVAMSFEGAGTDRLVIADLPAGSVMKITEVYSGAGYTLVSEAEEELTILAEEEVAAEFINTWDGSLNGGTGLVNTFSYDSGSGEWTHSAAEASTSGTQAP